MTKKIILALVPLAVLTACGSHISTHRMSNGDTCYVVVNESNNSPRGISCTGR